MRFGRAARTTTMVHVTHSFRLHAVLNVSDRGYSALDIVQPISFSCGVLWPRNTLARPPLTIVLAHDSSVYRATLWYSVRWITKPPNFRVFCACWHHIQHQESVNRLESGVNICVNRGFSFMRIPMACDV